MLKTTVLLNIFVETVTQILSVFLWVQSSEEQHFFFKIE